MLLDSKRTNASFLPNSTDSLYLITSPSGAYILRSGDFFVDDNDDNDNNDNTTDYFTPCACVRGNNCGDSRTVSLRP